MRKLKIATKESPLQLDNVPEEQQFIATLAGRYATTAEELRSYFSISGAAAESFREKVSIKKAKNG